MKRTIRTMGVDNGSPTVHEEEDENQFLPPEKPIKFDWFFRVR
jgi:hypothetical protein